MLKKLIPKKTRITLDLSPEFYNRLKNLVKRVDAESTAQAIREALKLYGYIVERSEEGDQFFVRTKDGKEEKLVFVGAVPL